ncbi:MAG TPA: CBS domain-containing protein [Burkholderiaceae bacterium]|jgi:CBS-domain-containing membrane protein|nr:CBS domain-containing protein [Burkholderiaceae bacterium]
MAVDGFSAAGEEDPGSAFDTLDTDSKEAPMPTIADIMTRDVQVIGPEDTLQLAAQLMDQLNVGSLPVCSDRELLGMVTDRDITVRGTAVGANPLQACVSDVMTHGTEFCTEDQDPQEVLRLMGNAQVRRLPVIDVDRKLVGVVSLGDLATRQPGPVDEAVRDISAPSEPDGGPANS